MNTIDRINRLRCNYNLPPFLPNFGSGAHLALDELDTRAGLNTKYTDGHSCDKGGWGFDGWTCPCNHTLRQVGARVALHEEHRGVATYLEKMRRRKGKLHEDTRFFHLGKEAECFA